MTIEQKVNMAVARSAISQAELARRMGQTPSNFNQKLKRETFKQAELEKMAEILGCKWIAQFQFDDGTVI